MPYDSEDFLHTDRDKYEDFHLLTLMYAGDLVTICDNTPDLEIFIRIFEETTKQLGLTISIKKICTMPVKKTQVEK